MLSSKKLRQTVSFKTKLLFTFSLVYTFLWLMFLAVVLLNYRSSINQLVDTQKKWLNIYTETLLNDLQVGNAYTVEKKLELLVRKDVFSEARLDFGRNVLSATREGSSATNTFTPSRFMQLFLPANTFKLEVRDMYNTAWGSLTATIDPNYLYKPVEEWIHSFGLYILAFYLLFFGVLLLFIEELATPLKGLIDYIGEFSRRNYDPKDIKNLLERKHDWKIREWAMLSEEFKTAVRNVSRLEGKVKNFERMAMIGQTTAMIAHDIRKPFSAIKVILNSLESFKSNPSALESGKREIERSINNVEKMVADLMDYGREVRLEKQPAPLVSLFDFVMNQVAKSYSKVNVIFRYDFKARFMPDVDEQRIARVFMNIVANGIEAIIAAGGTNGKIEIRSEQISWRGEQGVRVVIANDGPPIPDEIMPRLFEPFYTSGKRQGTGMGLASAQKIVGLHGGAIVARNRADGSGVEFIIDLPATGMPESAEQDASRLPRTNREAEQTAPRTFSEVDQLIRELRERKTEYRIVLLEDEALYRAWVKNTINSHPALKSIVAVYDANSVSEALKLVENEKIDYAIVDIDLGGETQNGFDFLARVKDRYPQVACLVHSNRHTEADQEKAFALGGKLFVRKPLRIEDLLTFLAEGNAPKIAPLDCVLIDDDSLVHFTWATAAKERGKKMGAFYGPKEFLEAARKLDPSIPIYIDSNLGDGLKGELVAKDIREAGFENLYLATGYSPENFGKMPWIKGIVGKDPPWAK